jgi:hypothetical protein
MKVILGLAVALAGVVAFFTLQQDEPKEKKATQDVKEIIAN